MSGIHVHCSILREKSCKTQTNFVCFREIEFVKKNKNESDVAFVVLITAMYTFQASERSRN